MRGSERNGKSDRSPPTRDSDIADSLDTTFDNLGDSYRRYLLYYLFEVDEPTVEVEAAISAVYNYETAGGETDHLSRDEIRTELYERHLPRLERTGVLDYDARQGTIRFTGRPQLEEWVEHARHEELD